MKVSSYSRSNAKIPIGFTREGAKGPETSNHVARNGKGLSVGSTRFVIVCHRRVDGGSRSDALGRGEWGNEQGFYKRFAGE